MMCATCYFVVVVAVFGSPLFSSARLLRGRRTRDRTVDPRARALIRQKNRLRAHSLIRAQCSLMGPLFDTIVFFFYCDS